MKCETVQSLIDELERKCREANSDPSETHFDVFIEDSDTLWNAAIEPKACGSNTLALMVSEES